MHQLLMDLPTYFYVSDHILLELQRGILVPIIIPTILHRLPFKREPLILTLDTKMFFDFARLGISRITFSSLCGFRNPNASVRAMSPRVSKGLRGWKKGTYSFDYIKLAA